MLRSFTRSLSSTAPRFNFARASFVGTVGHSEIKTSEKGVKYAKYSLAVHRYPKDREPETEWFNITAFDRVDSLEKVLRPGNLMHVEAHIQTTKLIDEDNKASFHTNYVQRSYDVLRFGRRPEQAEDAESEEQGHE
ncbi:uncharacterized protein SPAPADRAFT_61597 [Spathaspora passalidarum NRRL Y-27907]|uniref:Uncharacterized protein n=1 Tax=Spathaspora passalidarum (strain NRRL Y-27907 / 11-Y1) TaxID=619300 RepID=G3ANK4_SPAPN|nr:uncharacterized protein SPAPADRAFT_61597 [Spathaspora passalidarum NRRL Y-27907]EGW32533.1 hypothetical protein SPAPADRAFT_61597 [Spathaspora passalidarum NRRL Y-27907]